MSRFEKRVRDARIRFDRIVNYFDANRHKPVDGAKVRDAMLATFELAEAKSVLLKHGGGDG